MDFLWSRALAGAEAGEAMGRRERGGVGGGGGVLRRGREREGGGEGI